MADIQNWSKNVGNQDADAITRFSLVGLLLASFENSAATAAWMLWLLARRPDWQERIAAEARSEDATVWKECLNETLRLFPPVWSLAREVGEMFQWQGRRIEAGAVLFISPWVQGRLATGWTDPNRFLPQRWTNSTPTAGLFVPFGVGRRACPGEAFARQEIEAAIMSMLGQWRFETVAERVAPVPLFGLTQRPRSRVWLQAWPRR